MINYKGIYFEDDSGVKYQDPETGAHFEYLDMYRRLKKVLNQRKKQEAEETGRETEEPSKPREKSLEVSLKHKLNGQEVSN